MCYTPHMGAIFPGVILCRITSLSPTPLQVKVVLNVQRCTLSVGTRSGIGMGSRSHTVWAVNGQRQAAHTAQPLSMEFGL
jgi:hypothetical protein